MGHIFASVCSQTSKDVNCLSLLTVSRGKNFLWESFLTKRQKRKVAHLFFKELRNKVTSNRPCPFLSLES